MMRSFRRLVTDRTGSAAAEMGLVLPMLLFLLFSAVEAGHYFMSEHVVQKAVRDAARYAGRLPIGNYAACAPSAGAEQAIQRVARSGDPDGDWDDDGTPDGLVRGWTADSMTSVTVACDTSGTFTGLFSDFPDGVPVVTVRARVPYPTLFGIMIMGGATADDCAGGDSWVCLRLDAESQSAVFGA